MTSIRETISRYKGDISYLQEEKLKKLIEEFEKVLENLKLKVENEIEKIKESVIFADLSEPSKKIAQQVAKEEITKFKTETSARIQEILQNTKDVKKEIFDKVNVKIQEHSEYFENETEEIINQFNEQSNEILKKIENEVKEIKTNFEKNIETLRGPEGKEGISGKDADPEITANIVLQKLLPEMENKFTAESKTLIDKLISEIENKKLRISSIEGLNEFLQNLNRAIREKTKPQVSGGGGMGNIQHETFNVNSSTTTITTTYPIAGGGFAVWGYYNGSQIHRGTHFTVGSNRKICTLTFTPDDTTPSAVITLVYVRGA